MIVLEHSRQWATRSTEEVTWLYAATNLLALFASHPGSIVVVGPDSVTLVRDRLPLCSYQPSGGSKGYEDFGHLYDLASIAQILTNWHLEKFQVPTKGVARNLGKGSFMPPLPAHPFRTNTQVALYVASCLVGEQLLLPIDIIPANQAGDAITQAIIAKVLQSVL